LSGCQKNSVLLRLAESAFKTVKADAEQDITTVCYDENLHIAKTWPHKRRVIIKAQITPHPHRKPKAAGIADRGCLCPVPGTAFKATRDALLQGRKYQPYAFTC
jgi:hypothetical protein